MRRRLWICAVLILAILAVYGQVCHHGFVNYDDNRYVTENPRVQAGLTKQNLIWAFKTTHAEFWHPLTWLSHMLDWELYGANGRGHHLTSLVFHGVNTLLLFLVFERMTGAPWRSAFVAAFFALHPLHVESVAWIAERKDVLSTLFGLVALLAYTGYARRRRRGAYILALVAFVSGLMAKSMVVTLPFVLLLLDYWPLGRFRSTETGDRTGSEPLHPREPVDRGTGPWRYLVLEKIPFLAVSGVFAGLTVLAQKSGGAMVPLARVSFLERLMKASLAYGVYIVKTVFPQKLAVFYPFVLPMPAWEVIGATLLLVTLSILVVWVRRRHPYLMVGWFWYLGTLLPVIGLIQVAPHLVADRYTYVPLIGISIMIAWGVPPLMRAWRHRTIILAMSTAVVLVGLMVVTWFQVRHWKDSTALFTHALRVTSRNSLALNALGQAIHEQGRSEEALAYYARALEISPDFALAYNNRGVALLELGRRGEAFESFSEAVRHSPDDALALSNLGFVLAGQGRLDEAVRAYERSLEIDPDLVIARKNLADARLKQGRTEEAVTHYNRVLELEPHADKVHFNLGIAYTRLGKLAEATHHYREAVRIEPGFAQAYNQLGVLLARQGKLREALEQFSQAVRIMPRFAEAHANLCQAYWDLGDQEAALRAYGTLLSLDRDLAQEVQERLNVP